jgi:hypothetical protein
MKKPVRSVEATIARQLEQAILGHKASIQPSPSQLVVNRLMMALGVSVEGLAALMAAHPHPLLAEMDKAEIETWMASGAQPVAETSPQQYMEHAARLLGQLSIDRAEMSKLGNDLDFLATLQRVSPGTNILQLDAVSRAFVLYCQHMIGREAEQGLLDAACADYPRIAAALAEAIGYGAIGMLIKDPEADWVEFFTTLLEPTAEKPPLTSDQIRAKFSAQANKYKSIGE